jgi:hypothetical protein
MLQPNSPLAGHGEVFYFRKAERICNLGFSQFVGVPDFQVDRREVCRRTDALGKCDIFLLLWILFGRPIVVI